MNTPAHTVPTVQQFLTKHSMTPTHHPPFAPDLAQATFSFVSLDEKSHQREMFSNVEEVKQKMAEALKGIKIDEFKNCFEQ